MTIVEVKQIRKQLLLNLDVKSRYDIKNIQEKYQSKTGKKISLFCRYKPFWVIKLSPVDRYTYNPWQAQHENNNYNYLDNKNVCIQLCTKC